MYDLISRQLDVSKLMRLKLRHKKSINIHRTERMRITVSDKLL